jgi:DNA phosphorothioation-associated putative methyltransferase
LGKRVGTHLYVHRCGVEELPVELRALALLAQAEAEEQSYPFDVLKFGVREPALSLLQYPDFLDDAFPVLGASAKFDLVTQKLAITDYSQRASRPVLHRKELMLPPNHPAIRPAQALSRKAEELGLFENPSTIGTERGWQAALDAKGVRVEKNRLVSGRKPRRAQSADSQISRHRTALSRERLSVPFQLLQKYGYVEPTVTVLDYGCGKGDDVRFLADSGIPITGWDPHFFPESALDRRDVVNLGYVLNVIEDPAERERTLRDAFHLAGRVLCVSVLVGSPDYQERAKQYRDGLRTASGTFQKYFVPDEFHNFVRATLRAPCVPISQGTILAFASVEELERFRAKRAGLRGDVPRGSRQRASELYVFDEAARDTLDAFWGRCTELGREPLVSELDELADVSRLGLSPRAAFQFLLEKLGPHDIRPAMSARIEELLVEWALAHFDGRIFFKYLDDPVKKDIEAFFENYSDLRDQARTLLYSIADEEAILAACQAAAGESNGYLFGDHSLQLHVSLLERLPPLLRVFEGSAERLLGGRGRADLVKLHVTSGKVSYLAYDDFDGSPVPNLVERIKVDLPKRRIDYFDYIGPFEPRPLILKSLFLSDHYPNYELQEQFDRQMLKAGIVDPSDPHPSAEMLREALLARGLQIREWSLEGCPL